VTAEQLSGRRSPQRRRGSWPGGGGGTPTPSYGTPPPSGGDSGGRAVGPAAEAAGGAQVGRAGCWGGGMTWEPCPDATGKGSHPLGGGWQPPLWGHRDPTALGDRGSAPWKLWRGGAARLGGCSPFLPHHPCAGGPGDAVGGGDTG